ncbi:MoaD/ThiS family protein [Haladaptatus halobius]|uniref:MoaD/ThiS family protein n=1 Tax=Haladaptatus halobius TaxID=2884875 RepID=UPI001D0A96B6|nr:MoaD/ThiS family protein [Haladaptatus halobius]
MNVTVKLFGPLVARTGTRDARVAVPEEATVEDVVNQLGEKYGPQVSAGIVDGLGIRSDTRILRESEREVEPLSAHSPVEAGDTVCVQPNA